MQPDHADTAPEAMQVWLEHLRKMTPGGKIATVFELIRFARDIGGCRRPLPAMLTLVNELNYSGAAPHLLGLARAGIIRFHTSEAILNEML
jgi:hypothetical protein